MYGDRSPEEEGTIRHGAGPRRPRRAAAVDVSRGRRARAGAQRSAAHDRGEEPRADRPCAGVCERALAAAARQGRPGERRLRSAQPRGARALLRRTAADGDHPAARRRVDRAPRRRHRRDEHHAGVRHRANSRDRDSTRHRRARAGCARAVSDRGRDALGDRRARGPGDGLWSQRDPRARHRLEPRFSAAERARRHRRLDGDRRRLRLLPGAARGAPRPDHGPPP